MKTNDVSSICNALMDILVSVEEHDIKELKLNKGVMHLVDHTQQDLLVNRFQNLNNVEELGGSSLNAIRTLAALGAKTVFAGMIGKDQFGEKIQERMKELGIKAILQQSSESTGSCFVLVTPDGERTMNTNLGASVLFDESLVPFDEIAASRIFHFCGYQWGSAQQINAIHKALQHAQMRKTHISFDVADPFVVEANRDDFIEVIDRYADIVFANEREASLLFNSKPEEACKRICQSGAIAVIKLGAEGALIGKGDRIIDIAPIKAQVIDTTAAGDMFAAGFLYGQAKGFSLRESGEMAAILASDVISRLGATISNEALDKVKQYQF